MTPTISRGMTFLFALACGVIVANIYYPQPLAGPICASLGLPQWAAGLIVTMSQVGYGLGLLLLVPLGDIFENRRLVVTLVVCAMLSVLAAGCATTAAVFFSAGLCIGLSSVAVQVLVPYAAHMAPEASRGKLVGNVMSGLMLGIMLARPVASFITRFSSWHVVFFFSGGVMLVMAVVLSRALPRRVPDANLHYKDLLGSMWHLALHTPVLRRRAAYQSSMYGAFSLFWTATPLLLTGPQFNLTQAGVALFALAGVAGAVAAPLAGRWADRGWTRWGSALAMSAVSVAFLVSLYGHSGSTVSLLILTGAAILLDFGVSANLVFGQRAIFSLCAGHRSRLNGLYMATFFIGGALGSALGGWAYAHGGWPLAAWIGFAMPLPALVYWATEGKAPSEKLS
ncbi:MFS transporter [soil metagenome]